MIDYKLYFNESPLYVNTIDNTMYLSPNFLCPFEGTVRPESKVYSNTINIQYNKEYDYNELHDFVLPCCGNTIRIYVALHKPQDSYSVQLCIQRSDAEGSGGIPADWWTKLPHL